MAYLYSPHHQEMDANGDPLSGAKLYFYQVGTTTSITTYQDVELTSPHADPVVADSAGRFAPIYTNITPFKTKLDTSADVTVQTVQTVYGITGNFSVIGSDVTSDASLALGTDGDYFDVTGTTTITSIDARAVGGVVRLHFDGILTLTHHATNLILPSAANITTAAGDEFTFVEYASGDWRCTGYALASGEAIVAGGGGDLLSTNNLSDVVSAATSRSNLSAASLLDVRRDHITNPCAQVSAENGNTAGTTDDYYVVDEFKLRYVTSAGAVSVQRVQETTLAGALDRIRLSVTTADASLAAGEYLLLEHKVEGAKMAHWLWGTASTKDVVFRFMGSMPDQVCGISFQAPALGLSYVHEIDPAAADTDEVFEVAVPGPTTGTWPTGDVSGLVISWVFAAGSTFQTTADAWQSGNFLGTSGMANGLASNSNVFEIGDVGLRLDPDSTGICGQFEVPDEAQVELDCARYLPVIKAENTDAPIAWGGTGASTTIGTIVVSLPVKPRALITGITISAASHFAASYITGGVTLSALTFASCGTPDRVAINFGGTGFGTYRPHYLKANNASAKIIFTGARM